MKAIQKLRLHGFIVADGHFIYVFRLEVNEKNEQSQRFDLQEESVCGLINTIDTDD